MSGCAHPQLSAPLPFRALEWRRETTFGHARAILLSRCRARAFPFSCACADRAWILSCRTLVSSFRFASLHVEQHPSGGVEVCDVLQRGGAGDAEHGHVHPGELGHVLAQPGLAVRDGELEDGVLQPHL
eukprot:6189657-Pleurochrysis_carterae.AAC.1